MAPPLAPPMAAATAIEPPPEATADPIRAPAPAPATMPMRTFRCSSGIEAQLDKKNAAHTARMSPRIQPPRSKLVLVERDAKSAMPSLSKIAGKAKVSNCVQANLARNAHIYLRATRHARRKKLTDLKDFESPGLIGVFAPDNADDGHQRDFEVQRQAPIVNIPEIQLDPLSISATVLVCPRKPLTCAQPVMPGLTWWR